MAFWNLLYVASMPIVKILLISDLGMVLSTHHVNVMTDQCLKHLNKIVYIVFTPALLFSSLAESVTLKDLISWWSMPLNALFTYIIGTVLGWIVVKLTKPPKELKGIVLANCCAGNMGSFLLIVVPSLCQENESLFGETSKCETTATAYVSLSLAIGTIYVWTYGYSLIRASSIPKANEDEVEEEEVQKIQNSEYLNPEEKSDLETALINSHDPCSEEIPSEKQSSNDKAHSTLRIWYERLYTGTAEFGHLTLHVLKEPPNIAVISGFVVGAVSQLKSLLVGDSAPLQVLQDAITLLGDGTIPGTILVLGGNLLRGLKSMKLHPLIIISVVCVKLIILPLIGIWIVKGASHIGLLPNDPLYQFVLMIQYTVPPAMSLGTMTQLLNVGNQECSVLFFWTYLVSSVSITIWSTVFMLFLDKTF